MPKIDYQRNAFLGGEVSPSLYERTDMDKFSHWFSKAENIRFQDTGGFRSRKGFMVVARTKNNSAGEVIKLISFSFNDEESFLVEFGPGYARFFKDGSPIMVNGAVYEISTPFISFKEEDLKYAQAGDTIFLVHPQYGIYELVRKNIAGTDWEIKKFAVDHMPMGDENTDQNDTLSLENTIVNYKFIQSIKIPVAEENDFFYGPKLYKDNVLVWEEQGALVSYDQCVLGMRMALSSAGINVYYNNNTFTFTSTNVISPVFRFEAQRYRVGKYSVTNKATEYYHDENAVWKNPTYVGTVNQIFDTDYVKYVKSAKIKARVSRDNGRTYNWETIYVEADDTISFNNSVLSIIRQQPGFHGSSVGLGASTAIFTNGNQSLPLVWGCDEFTLETTTYERYDISATGENQINSERPIYSLSANYSNTFFADHNLGVGDEISVTHIIGAQHINDNVYQLYPNYTSREIFSDGHWRIYCTGVWLGTFTLYYSTDNKKTWHECYSWSSKTPGHAQNVEGSSYNGATEWPNNPNTSGYVESKNTVWFKVTGGIHETGATQNAMNLCVNTDTYNTNSYYRILAVTSGNSAIVECTQNDTGTFSQEYRWKTQAFSASAGYPQVVGFYQNRLFFGKDYILYGSKSNDFRDFYEPIKLKDDDPVVLSLLSSKVNSIKNIVTQRSFFVFTGGGEFGIGSEGALTQTDRYLKPFSANGSATCLPVLINEVVLFVDKSERAVRALKYTLESDGYEAPDITLALTYLLRNERIISTDTIFEEKEALFLSETGTVWVLKYIPDQEVLSWSHWKHAYGKITNICVVPNGAKNDLYIAVESENGGKWIEKLTDGVYMDSCQKFEATSDSSIKVFGIPGEKRVLLQNGNITISEIAPNNTIPGPADHTKGFLVGAPYVATGTLLTPTVPITNFSHSTYMKRNPFKVWFYYTNSFGFKVGVEEDEKMSMDFNDTFNPIDNETDLTSGKKSVNIPSRFDGSARVSFVQDAPFPMEIQDVLIETDFGGK